MDMYDVAVVGGGIAGSVAARFSAEQGFKTLLLERYKTPRNKPCSGIQFPYLEKLVGKRIPQEMLCKNELFKVEMMTPSGKVVKGSMKMLNFWRSTFDYWLNSLAIEAGAHFMDECRLLDFNEEGEYTTVGIVGRDGERQLKTRYLIGADGMKSTIRRKLRPQDFKRNASGATVNYYFVGDANLDPYTLYMFYNMEFSPLMFAWVYMKDNMWVVGTGADNHLLKYAGKFLRYVQEKYVLRGEMVKKEGFATPMETSIFLGQRNLLMAGDAAGLVDLYRGLGMDNAALSGRLAVNAIIKSEQTNSFPIEHYQRLMAKTVSKLRENEKKQAARYATNETLEKSLSPLNLMKGGLFMLTAAQLNKILPPEKIILLPL